MSVQLRQVIRGVPDSAHDEAKRYLKEDGGTAREAVREAMRLNLKFVASRSNGERNHRIETILDDGVLVEVGDLEFPDELGARLTPYRSLFDNFARDGANILGLGGLLSTHLAEEFTRICPEIAIQTSVGFAEEIIRRIDNAGVITKIFEVDGDVLGSYRAESDRSGVITLYWPLIWLVSSNLGCSFGALLHKVYSHEYVHAMSHLGIDSNGQSWETRKWWKANPFVHEGLANFFSYEAMKRSTRGSDEALRVLAEICKRQTEKYREYQVWQSVLGGSPEAVRAAMLEARNDEVVDRTRFHDLIAQRARALKDKRHENLI